LADCEQLDSLFSGLPGTRDGQISVAICGGERCDAQTLPGWGYTDPGVLPGLVRITIELPDDIAEHPGAGREALEALAIERYRRRELTQFQVGQLLGLSRGFQTSPIGSLSY